MNAYPQQPKRVRRRAGRHGGVYILVVGTALVVSVLGMSSIMIGRIQRRSGQVLADVAEARLHAQAALRVGMMRIEDDPDWRYRYENGAWESDIPFANGSYTLEGIDPTDDQLDDGPEDAVTLIGTGKSGYAVYKTSITLAPANRGFTCLEAALHTGKDLIVDSAELYCDQIVSANQDAHVRSTTLDCSVEVGGELHCGTYTGDTTVGIDPRTMPDTGTVFDYYLENGTWIDADALPRGYSNLCKNPGFEDGTSNWTSTDSAISATNETSVSGKYSVVVTDRLAYYSGLKQDVTASMQQGASYDVSAWVKVDSSSSVGVKWALGVESSSDGLAWFYTSETGVDRADGWQYVSETLSPSWSGTLLQAHLWMYTKNGDVVTDFRVDDTEFKETGSERTMHHQLLSPKNNPFGAETNGQGIYVIDLAGQKIFIDSCRIVGTLILLEPHFGSRIGDRGPLSWEPAIAGFPALMVRDTDVTINPNQGGLSEDTCQTNFNPVGAPYGASGEDADLSDTYASQITGLIYGTDKVYFEDTPAIHGAVIAQDNIEVNGDLSLTHNPTYLTNPPPGFNGPEEIRVLLDSATKVTAD